jgi:hypothetical protein
MVYASTLRVASQAALPDQFYWKQAPINSTFFAKLTKISMGLPAIHFYIKTRRVNRLTLVIVGLLPGFMMVICECFPYNWA